jgi:hypothetical protein
LPRSHNTTATSSASESDSVMSTLPVSEIAERTSGNGARTDGGDSNASTTKAHANATSARATRGELRRRSMNSTANISRQALASARLTHTGMTPHGDSQRSASSM